MAKGYWVANIDVTDMDGYKAYVAANAEAFRKFGAKFLIRGGRSEAVEGKLDVARPFDCPVGCSRCQSVCPQNAIHFMESRDLNMFLKQLRRQRAGM